MGRLDRYLAKRDFSATPEPSDPGTAPGLALRYSMQKHDATRLHWDLRLEWEGVLLSWAVTRGPSFRPEDKRLAVRTEDHPVSYLDFEGRIPKGSYGAGTVMLFDIGHWQPLIPPERGLRKGHLHFRLHGLRLTGGWHLVRLKDRPEDRGRENWLLMKEEDEAAGARDPVRRYTRSVSSHATLRDIAADRPVAAPTRSGPQPRFRKPQLAQADGQVGVKPWHELKFDGYRALVSLGKSGTRVFTRNGHDWTDRFASLLPAFEALETQSALLDGEIVAGAGLSGFGTLQKAIKLGGPFGFFAFDLIEEGGESLADLPLHARRTRLEGLFRQVPALGQVQLSPLIGAEAGAAFETICAAGGEGLIGKDPDAPYRAGRSPAWIKIKCRRRDDFTVIGWTESTSRARPFGALLLAGPEGYAGKVGTGFDAATMEDVAARLKPLATKEAPVKVPRAESRGAHWVRPSLRAEVDFAEVTSDGRLRHASFLGLREDVVVAERDAGDRIDVAGIGISSPTRVVYPKARRTKLDVARYYEAVAPRMLPSVADRPLALVRLPEGLGGERFFQKHAHGFPDAVKETSGGEMYVTSAAGLVAAAQMGALEVHVQGVRRDRPDRPDRMVFDLDPDEGLGFAATRKAAVELRTLLERLGLPCWPMVTGGKGVHLVVPLRRTAGWDTVSLFARTLATVLAERQPSRFVSTMSKARREGRIFVDWLRNQPGATAVAPFSLRAREGAPVAVPVTWEELGRLRRADGFDMGRVLAETDRAVPDIAPASLSGSVITALEAWISAS